MVRLNCHSAWQHYEMFHSRGGDVINIGSNNTTIFNMGGGFDCGNFWHGSGNFWSGFGFGIGNSLGSIFGGLFGGSMNPYYCNYANPFSFMNPYSMIAGGGARPSKNDDKNCTCHCKDKPSNDKTCNDPDQKKLLELGKEVNDLKANDKSTKQDAEALLNKLKDAKKASEKEGHHDDTDPGQFQNWIDNLTAHMKAKGWLDGQETKPDANKANADDFDAKLKAAGDDEAKLLDLLSKTTDPAQRAKILAKLGYTTYDGKEKITKDNMKLVRDMGLGKSADISTCVDVDEKAGSHPEWIKMKTTFSEVPVQYNFVGIEDGEYIYQSQSGKKQKYALYKNADGYTLIQFPYHGSKYGYNIPDQTRHK